MYNNIGKACKVVGTIILVITILLSLIGGIAFMLVPQGFLYGVLVIVLGCLSGYIESLVFFGVSKIFDNFNDTNQALQQINSKLEEMTKTVSHNKKTADVPKASSAFWVCSNCHRTNSESLESCWNCKTKRDEDNNT